MFNNFDVRDRFNCMWSELESVQKTLELSS